MNLDRPAHACSRDLTDDVSFDDLVKEMDAILDGWLSSDDVVALEESQAEAA